MTVKEEKKSPLEPSLDFTKDKDENSKPDREPEEVIPRTSYFGLYKYATPFEKLIIFIGIVVCLSSGAIQPVNQILFGDLTNAFIAHAVACRTQNSPECDNAGTDLLASIAHFALWNSVIGVFITLATYLGAQAFSYTAIKQVFRVRTAYLKKLLDKDIPWFDVHKSGDFASRMSDDLSKFEEGIGEKVALFIILQGTFISGITIALVRGWKLALVCLGSLPVSMIAIGLVAFLTTRFSEKELDAYGSAGAIAEEVLSSIRTVVAFGGEQLELTRYDKGLIFAKKNNIKRHMFEGIGYGLLWLCVYSSYGLAFWYGVDLLLSGDPTYTAGNMITVFFSVMTASMSFGMASPMIEAFAQGQAAGSKIFHIIDSNPTINFSKGIGEKLEYVKGSVELKDVSFQYPSRKEVSILNNINLTINAGETVALVGNSGCGKSTVLQLVQRFYDPLEGQVLLDGNNIKDLDLTWYRQNIGVVSQEPVLFGTTIAENIKYGHIGATEKDVIEAAKLANAHQFIQSLPNGYQTLVGERGAKLSGGQKQRIAIARALVRNPAILLLDEATSALDTNSEAKVQKALDRASKNRTTIIVAHRLTTIRGANKIIVISNGKVVEQGTHDELMQLNREYYTLVTTQVQGSEQFENSQTKQQDHQIIDEDDDDVIKANAEPDEEDNVDDYRKKASLWSIVKLNSTEWHLLLMGSIGAAGMGLAMPVFALIFGNILGVLQKADIDPDYVRSESNTYSSYFVAMGGIAMIATFLQMYMFGRAGQILTHRIRVKMFSSLMKQEMAYFDRTDNGVGSLCAKLSNEAANVQGATGQRIGAIVSSLATAAIAIFISVYYEWRIGLLALAFFPIIITVVFVQRRQLSQDNDEYKASLEKSTKVAVEAVSNIRTVASLGCEDIFYNIYVNELAPHVKTAKKTSHWRSLVLGFSRAIMLFAISTCIYYGGFLIRDNKVSYEDVMKVSQALLMSTISIANSLAFTPNLEKGLIAAKVVMNLVNRLPRIRDHPEAVETKEAEGNLEYSKVTFSYPTRKTAEILKGLDLTILQGKTVALVGHSGCGKSTIVQLLERFYDPASGQISLDSKDISSMTLRSLRSHLGIVSQEPNLFSRTIAENIAYGDTSRQVEQDEIIKAAKQANIHNFIVDLPLGYETKLGEKGTQLSGGQKQRIAIARALIRNPKVLLLDEATSALDAESEKVVQVALDNAKQGRTCLTIAHRLSTIKDADLIAVINEGIVAELGTHDELLEKKGLYYKLHSLQP